jgi:uncharacterized caspase-like protein
MQKFFGYLVALCALIVSATNAGFAAEPPEKRIALVLGNAAYQAGPLQTAANDAGLIAQTLQAAAFDVVGARDLDQDGLRRAFRDFLEKASQSGPNTVAFIYLSGYALKLEGENYFLPVDAKIARDTDVVAEGVRISDYLRPLAALNLKAGIVVVDGARKPVFAASGQPLAGGLALMEPPAGMLVAFNAAPGTVALDQSGPYGTYAQALAEMMREPGLTAAALFDRVRLRVSDVTHGAQLPWSASKITAPFVFFERSPDAPAVISEQNATVHGRRIAELDVKDAYVLALERDALEGYEEFLSAYPDDALAERVRAIVAVRREALTWRRTCLIDTPEAYWSYLRRYPHGLHGGDARRRLALLSVALEPPSSFALVDYDVPPPPAEEGAYVDRPFIAFADFDFVPPPPLPIYFLPPPPDFEALEAPIIAPEPYVLPVPVFLPVPDWCQVPHYVGHPRDNLLVDHIHDTFVADRAARAFAVRTHAGQPGVTAPIAHAALAASLPPSVRSHRRDPSASAAVGAPHSAGRSVTQPLPGMHGQPLPRLPGRLQSPLGRSESSAMAAVPPAGARVHRQQTPGSTPPFGALPRSLPGVNGRAMPPLPQHANRPPTVPPSTPLARPTPPPQAHVPPPQVGRPSPPALANRPPPAAPFRAPSPPPAVHAPPRPPTAALSPPRPPVQSVAPPRPMIHAPPAAPRPPAPAAAPPRPMVHAVPPAARPAPAAPPRPMIQAPPRAAPPAAAPPRPMVQAPPPRPAPPAAAPARPPAPAAPRPPPPKRG